MAEKVRPDTRNPHRGDVPKGCGDQKVARKAFAMWVNYRSVVTAKGKEGDQRHVQGAVEMWGENIPLDLAGKSPQQATFSPKQRASGQSERVHGDTAFSTSFSTDDSRGAYAGGAHTTAEMDHMCVLPSVKRLVEFLRKDIPGCEDGACDVCNRVRKDRGEKPWVRKGSKKDVVNSRQRLPLHYDHYGPLLYMAAVLPESWYIMGITGLRLVRKCLQNGCITESEKDSLNGDCPHLFRILVASQPEGHVRGSSYKFEPDFMPFLHDLCSQFLMIFPEANLRRPLKGEAPAKIPSQAPVQSPPQPAMRPWRSAGP
jgi:hypothetical protein